MIAVSELEGKEEKCPGAVQTKGVDNNSILSQLFTCYMHKRYSGIRGRLKKMMNWNVNLYKLGNRNSGGVFTVSFPPLSAGW